MSKRSRRERREGQAQRALETQDPAFFTKLAQTNPELAAQHLGRLLGELRAEEPSPLDQIAAELCAQLRHAHKLKAARTLASGAAHRSPRLRLEHALTAFALGEDSEAERTAAADPAVASIMAPLLQVAREAASATDPAIAKPDQGPLPGEGAVPPPELPPPDVPVPEAPPHATSPDEASATKSATKSAIPRGKKPPAKKRAKAPAGSPALVGLHNAAIAVGAAMRGQVRSARQTLRRIPFSEIGTVLSREIQASFTITIEDAGAPQNLAPDLWFLCRSEVVQQSAAVRESLVGTLAHWNPGVALETGQKLGMSAAVLRPIQLRTTAKAPASSASATQAALDLARTVGAAAFDPEHRAAASLYEGFACIHSDRRRAERAFDRAVELGADLVEALRGKLLLAMSDGGEVCPECGVHHPAAESGHDVGAAAERFARAVRRLPAGLPFAAAASLIAARGWESEGNTKAAVAAIHSAREISGEAMSAELDLREAKVLGRESPQRAAALLDGLIARDPRDLRPWQMKIELARKAHDDKREADLLVQAAAATGDPTLMAKARALRIRRGELVAFAGLTPGSVTAGALAAEAEPWLSLAGASKELPAAALACRAALAPPARLAFDVALIAIEGRLSMHNASARFIATLGAWWDSPPLLAKLATTAWLLGIERTIVPEARRRAYDAKAGAALAALFGAAMAARDALTARQLVTLGAASWSRMEVRTHKLAVQQLQRYLGGDSPFGPTSPNGPPDREGFPSPDAVRHEIDALLAPEFQIAPADDDSTASGEDFDFDDDFDFDEILGDHFEGGPRTRGDMEQLGSAMKEVFRTMGLAPSLGQRLPTAKKVELMERLARLAEEVSSPGNLSAMKRETMKFLGRGGA